jgi:hypothetical protein
MQRDIYSIFKNKENNFFNFKYILTFFLLILSFFTFSFSKVEAAITYVSASSVVYSASSGNLNLISPSYPSSVASGNLVVLIIGQKPSLANTGTVITPEGWTPITSLTGAGGYGTTLGVDTGNTNVYAYYRIATSSLSGTVPIVLSNNNVAWAQIFRLTNATGSWNLAGATGSDVTAGTAVEINFSSDPGVAAGDFILGAFVSPTDVTLNQFSAQALTQSGVTFGTVTEIGEPRTGNQWDINGFTYQAPVSAGTSAGNPTLTATAGGTTTNTRGPGIFIRIRETNVSAAPVVTTNPVSNIGATMAEGGGAVTNDSDRGIIERGVVWNTSSNPTTSNSKAVSSGGEGMDIKSQMTNLEEDTLYYVRAYATNSAGTGYGDNITFTTTSRPVTTLNTSEAYNFGADNTPSLEMTATDADGDVVLYNVQISKNNTLSDRWVAVGTSNNRIAYSDDNGITWSGVGGSIFAINSVAYSVAWNGNMFVVVGSVGIGTNSIAYSIDGINWTGLGTSIFSTGGYGIAWNGSMWVATGQGTNSLAYSTNGIDWTGLGTSIFSTAGWSVAWNGSMWVATGQGTNSLAYSTNGIDWTGVGTSIFSTGGYGIAWNGSMWVATGQGTNSLAYSTNGIDWTGVGTSIFSTAGWSVAWNGLIWVAVGTGTANRIAYSTDGINWTGLGTSIFSTGGYGIAWNGSMWVATGQGTNSLAYSTNGIDWTGLGTSIFSTAGRGVTSTSPTHLVPAIPDFHESSERVMAVAVGYGTNSMAYSTDGISWTGLGTSIFSLYGYGVAWNGSMWVAVGYGGTNSIAYSTNGINWTGLGRSIFSGYGYSIAWNGSMWVAVGEGTVNTMAYSTNGIDWTGLGKSIFSSSGWGITWNGTMWVAVGNGTNTIAYSYNGIDWTGLGTSIFSTNGYGVAWNGSMWVATGNGTNTIAYSNNGTSWTGLGTSVFSTIGRDVAWNGSMWVAVGNGTNTIVYSYNGIDWTGLGVTILGNGLDVAWNGTMWIATGSGTNTIAYSINGTIWTGLGITIFSTLGYGVAFNSSPNLYPPILKQGTDFDTGFINTVTGTDSSSFTQGQKVSYTIPEARFLNNGTYYWRARAMDKFGSKEYGAWSSVRSFIIAVVPELPTITTEDITNIDLTSAIANGEIVDRGNVINDKRGFVYDTTSRSDPGNVAPGSSLYADKVQEEGVFVEGLFTASLSSLLEDTTYYVRSYSHNEAGYSYGDEISFKTLARPVITLETNDGHNFGTDTTPTLRMVATDVDLSEVNYHIQVHTTSNFIDTWVAVGTGTNTIAHSTDGIDWTGLGTSIFGTAGWGVAWNGDMFVAVGQGTNSMAYSTDGINWNGLGTTTFSSYANGIAWNGTMWVATGQGTNTIAYSTNGTTWTGLGTSIFSSYGYGIAWSGSMWIATGQGTNTIAYSANGISWTGLGTTIFSTGGRGVAYNGSMWVATGEGTNSIAYSTDGTSWTGAISSFFDYGYGIAWNGIMWVAVGSGTSNTMAYSYNGIHWQGLGKTIFSSYGYGIVWNGDIWVATGYGTINTLAYSTDGIFWTGLGKTIFTNYATSVASSSPLNFTPEIPKVDEKSERKMWVGVGSGADTIAYSTDGIVWIGLGATIFSTTGWGVAYNGSMWVAVGSGTNSIAYSNDGISWTGLGVSIFSLAGWNIAWNGSMWVAVGQGTNTIAYSNDGISWTGLGNSILELGRGIAWNGSMWVAVGQGTNSIAYSTDGINWTGLDATIFTTSGYDIAWNGNMWVAVGWGTNHIAYSYDGINWTGLGTSIFGSIGYGVAWNGSMWVAVGQGTNHVAYSYDGINWTGLGTSMFSTYGNKVAWNGSMWVAVGSGVVNRIAISLNGIDWTSLYRVSVFSIGRGIASNSPVEMVPSITKQGSMDTGFTNEETITDQAPFIQGEVINYEFPIEKALEPGTYYWRARAIDTFDSGEYSEWSAVRSFIIIPITAPIVETNPVTNIEESTATGNGEVTADGGATITERGIVWSTTVDPTILDNKATAVGTIGVYTAPLTGLVSGETYYVRAYATNSVGTGYGDNVTFTPQTKPTITQNIIDGYNFGTDITPTLAFTGTDLNDDDVGYNIEIHTDSKFVNKWIAVGEGVDPIVSSVDGINWSGTGGDEVFSIGYDLAWNGNMWVVVGEGTSNTIAYSTNGTDWTGLENVIFSVSGLGIAWNGNMWVATGIGTNSLAYSYNGRDWTGLGTSVFSTGYGIAWNGNMWVATGNGTNTLAYSYDGINWTGFGYSVFSFGGMNIAWNGNMWIATGIGTNSLAYSEDGISWTGLGSSIFSLGRDIAWNGNIWVAVGQGGANTITYSEDGLDWIGLGVDIFSTAGHSVAWNGNMWVATGAGTNTIAYSVDGMDWAGLGEEIFTTGHSVASNTPTTFVPTYSFINKNSSSDTGFVNIETGGDTHPFNQDERISYTVQNQEQLYPQTYYWRVRANDPNGSNTYSDWSETRSFIISDVWQLGYRIFENENGIEVGAPIADQNNIASLENDKFRLRTLLYTPKGLGIGNGEFKLQYAEKGVSCYKSFFDNGGIDVTNDTEIAFYDNYGAEDKEALTTNVGDPTFEAKTVVGQSYVESNNFNIIDNISTNQLGLFDFSLYYKGVRHEIPFCLRIVHSDGRRLENYSFFPEIISPIYRSRGGGGVANIEPIEDPDDPVGGGGPGGGGGIEEPIEEPDEPIGGGNPGGGGGGDDLGYLNFQYYFYFNQDSLLIKKLFKNLFAFIN